VGPWAGTIAVCGGKGVIGGMGWTYG
jgi:hypothetical protein